MGREVWCMLLTSCDLQGRDYHDILNRIVDSATEDERPDLLRIACNNPHGSHMVRNVLWDRHEILGLVDDDVDAGAPHPKLQQQLTLLVELMQTCIIRRHEEAARFLLCRRRQATVAQYLGKRAWWLCLFMTLHATASGRLYRLPAFR